MANKARFIVGVTLVLAVLGVVSLTTCTREKPAPTPRPTWVPPTATPVLTMPGLTPGATVISVEETPSGAGPGLTSVPGPTATPIAPPSPTPVLPTPVRPTPVPVGPTFTYIVAPGDTLYSIARRYDTTVDVLVSLNSLTSADDIKVGQQLRIPGTGPTPAATEAPAVTVHVVQRGETLYSIAVRYGVPMQDIMAANGITNPDRIRAGQELRIPGVVQPTPTPRTHVVQRGETLLAIALRYGVTMQELQAANGISDPDLIKVGQVLIIP
ncbi:MAG: LysM peptidoglycan-binding domain-containing protein [Anaerolineae bacterium]|nr:LysM peptidoglycan-binding domain-containing protein [Anaerolineae bacterium]